MLRNQVISTISLLSFGLSFACEEPEPSVTDKPAKPTAEIEEVVCASPAPISGTKQSSTSIWINGKEVVPLDEKSTWSASIEVMEGKQTLSIIAKSATDQESDKTRKSTTLDLTKPTTPALAEQPPAVVQERMYTLSGTKEAGTGISIDGMVAVAADASETWTAEVMLVSGPNTLKITARDTCRDSDILELDLFQDDTGIGLSVDPVTSPTCDDNQTITGKRAPGVAVLLNDNLIVEAGPETEWSYTVMLTEGDNTLNFVGQVGTNISLPHSVVIEYDSTSPAPPILAMAPPEFTSNPDLMMSGTKEANTAIIIDDSEVVAQDAATTFMFSYTLMSGLNFLQIDTRDFCGRTSGNPEVHEVILDDTMPMLAVTAPMTGDTLTGLALIEGEATDNASTMMAYGIASINIAVDGQPLVTIPRTLTDTSTFAVTWDTTQVTDGAHLLSITAIDIAGLSSTPVALMVDVANLARIVSDDPPPAMWNMDPAQARSSRPGVAVTTNGAVGVVWRDNVERAEEENDKDIYLRLYGTGSSSGVIETVSDFTSPLLDGVSENANVCPAGSGGLHIVWKDDGELDSDNTVDKDIYYRHHDGTSLATNPLLVSQGTPPDPLENDYESNYPHLAVDGTGLAHVVWQDNGNRDQDDDSEYDIYYASGGQNGFNPPVLISDDVTEGVSTVPRIAITPDNCPHVVWQDDGDLVASDNDMGLRDIYYRGATPNMGQSSCTSGFSWGPIVLISEENGFNHAYRPRIYADSADSRGLLYITWRADNSNVINNGTDSDIFMANFYVPTAARGSLILISDDVNDGVSRNSDVLIDSLGNVYVSWEDNGNVNGAGTDYDIFLRMWNGSTFSPYSSISDIGMNAFNTGISIEPSMAIDGTQLIMVWEDNSDYDGDMINDYDVVMLIR